ncbi:MAG TPA: sigma-70 family RNA polymerase sigma factor [bacterium]|nr:sigma-70 family RNA polymerase sigma factor [bacterium]
MAEAASTLERLAGVMGATAGAPEHAGARRLAAFEELLQRHLRRIYRVAYRLTGNPDDAEDLSQEAIVEAFRAFDRYQPGTYFDRWVCRIMTRTHIDRVRRRRLHPEVSLDAPLTPGGDPRVMFLGDVRDDPQHLTEVTDLDGPVQTALDALPAEFRTTVVLADVEGLSYDEVAAAVGCPVGTVRSRLHRARGMLRNALRPHLTGRKDEE